MIALIKTKNGGRRTINMDHVLYIDYGVDPPNCYTDNYLQRSGTIHFVNGDTMKFDSCVLEPNGHEPEPHIDYRDLIEGGVSLIVEALQSTDSSDIAAAIREFTESTNYGGFQVVVEDTTNKKNR